MKKLFKYLPALILSGLLSIALINTADAQHRGGGGHGGGGGSRGGGGSHFAGGGSRGGGSFRGGSSGYHGASFSRGGAVNRSVGVRGGTSYRGGSFNRATVGVRGGTAYRGSVRGGIGYNRGYYGGGRYYGGRGYYRGGRYYGGYGPGFRFGFGFGYPHIGFYLGYLPFGYYPFYFGSLQYYYYGGAFYRPYNGGYEVVAPPVGAAVPSLPSNAQAIQIDGVQYYEASGVYYQESVDDNGHRVYIVVGKDGVLNTGNNVSDQQPMTDSDDPIMDNSNMANSQPQPQATRPAAELTIKVGDVVDQLPPDCRKVTLNNKKFFVSADNIFYEEFKDANGTGYRVASIPGETDQ
jgi:hypothetical protein